MPGSEINDDNEIAQMIGEKWGVRIKETWLTGQTASEATGMLNASDEYPDYIDSDDMSLLVDAGALIPLDDYIDQYPEFKEKWFTEDEWEKFRQPDGHIYWINPFGNTKGEPTVTTHNDEAFWIQVRVGRISGDQDHGSVFPGNRRLHGSKSDHGRRNTEHSLYHSL